MNNHKESPITHIKTKNQLLQEVIGRRCACGSSQDYDDHDKATQWHCPNKRCPWHNIITLEHSVHVNGFDLLYRLVFKNNRGFCKCIRPQKHTIPQYEICVNKNCFRVFREYKDIMGPWL